MIGTRMSSTTRELVRLAKADGPSAAARAKMWTGVSNAIGGVAAAGGSGAAGSAAGSTATLGAAKMLTIGTLLGGPLTVGLAAVMLQVGPAPAPRSTPGIQAPPASVAQVAVGSVPEAAGASIGLAVTEPVAARLTVSLPATQSAAPHPGAHVPVHPKVKHAAGHDPSRDDGLGREAGYVMEAHAALVRGDAAGALRAIAAARASAPPQLVPEELAVEGQALRALGRTSEADANDAMLRLFYPEAALAR